MNKPTRAIFPGVSLKNVCVITCYSGLKVPVQVKYRGRRPQTIIHSLSLERGCMKIWCTLNRNPANRWCESCALWSSFPVAYVSKIFLGKLL
jgi:hypothetical protein